MPPRSNRAPPAAPKARPNFSRTVRLLIRHIAQEMPEFAHVRAERILVVAGEARRASRATIRPMRFAETGTRRSRTGHRRKPQVIFRGRQILYVITLRPLFFRNSTPEQRIETVIHELFHISSSFNGTLDPNRRHKVLSKAEFDGALRPLVKRYLPRCPAELHERLAGKGEVLVRHWLERPPNSYRPGKRQRTRYTAAQTYLGPVRLVTRRPRH